MLRSLGAVTRQFLADRRPMLINGIWHATAIEVPSVNPADGEVIGGFCAGGVAEVNAAVAAARDAFARRAWHGLPPAERARVMQRIADLIDRDAENLAEL